MKKVVFTLCFFAYSFLSVSALSCVDIKNNLMKKKETNEVLLLQNFLYEKGFLSAKPNGYFGNGTVLAVKKYQKSIGLTQSGQVFPLTRAKIKKETCGITEQISTSLHTKDKKVVILNNTSSNTVPVTTPSSTLQKVPLTQNEQRQKDVVDLITAMYAFYLDSNGTFPISYITDTPIELCTAGISFCEKLNEIKSSLVPKFLASIPSDPSTPYATSSGYFITRSLNGDITITAPKASGVAIFATCNFIHTCSIATTLKPVVLGVPHIESLNIATFLSGGVLNKPFTIFGNDFSSSTNIVNLYRKGTGKKYLLGSFSATNHTTIIASSSFTNKELSCGISCKEVPPVGDYEITVTTNLGESNAGYLSIKNITANSISNALNTSFIPKSTHVKLATLSLSSSILVDIKKLNIYASSSPVFVRTITPSTSSTSPTISTTTLPALFTKLSNFTITDVLEDKIINSGPLFTFQNQTISNNQSKIYELYADIGEIDNVQAGQVILTGDFVVQDYLTKSETTLSIPKFVISISY